MTIKNKQLEDAPRVNSAGAVPATGANKGSFYPKIAGAVVEAHYKDDQGREIQLTENGLPKGPPSFGEANTASNASAAGEGLFIGKVGVDLQFKRIQAGPNIVLTPQADRIVIEAVMPVGSGEANTGSNVGLTGLGVFKQKSGVDFQFRRIKAGTNIALNYSPSGDEIEIAATGAAAGETNTASNLGTAGDGQALFTTKVGVDLPFKRIKAGTNVVITSYTNYIEIAATGGGTGEANTASNLGAGTGVFAQKSALDLQFKSLVAGANVSITSTATEITIAATAGGGGEINTASNLGTISNGSGLFVSKVVADLQFKRIKAGSGIQITEEANNINIINTGGAGESNTASNLGTGSGVFAQKSVVDLQFKSIKAGTNVSVTATSTEITISATGGSGEVNTASNVGTGNGVFASKVVADLQFKSLKAGTNITMTPSGTEILISATGGSGEVNTASNVGTGAGVFAQKSSLDLQFKSLKAGTNITLTPSGTEILIDAAGGGGATVYEYALTLPAAATLAARLALVTGLPAGWSLATADTASIGEFGSSSTTLVITHSLSKFHVLGSVIEKNPAGPSPITTQGYSNIYFEDTAKKKTNIALTATAFMDVESAMNTARDYTFFLKFM